MNRSHTYDVFTSLQDIPYSSPPKTNRSRLRSLQTIKVSHRGLPPDFFTQRTPDLRGRLQNCKKRARTLPNDNQDIRATPTFQQSFVGDIRQARQCRSEERPNKSIKIPQGISVPLSKEEPQMTFSKSFFPNNDRPVPKTLKLRIKRGRQTEQNEFTGVGMDFFSPLKQQLTDIMRKKHLDRQRYPYLLTQRTKLKHQNKLPTLRGRFPSAFGI